MTRRFELASTGSEVPQPRTPVSLRPDLLTVPVSEPRSGVLVVAPVGEVDLSTAGLLREVAFRAVDAGPKGLVVDMSGLLFCGSTGLVVLMDARSRADAGGVSFRTAAAGRAVRRVLQITNLLEVFRHCDSVDEAIAEIA
jgi:anti-sigma B factor antagonist